MSEVFEARLDGWEQVGRLLGRDGLERWALAVLKRLAEEIKAQATPYPPEGPWNAPGPYPARWYQRHFGPRWARADGSVGGSNTSEQLQKQWLVEQRGAAQVVVANRASYAPWVMGEEQAALHAAHGWRKLKDIAAEVMGDRLAAVAREELDKLIAQTAGPEAPAEGA
ncbi:MAG: hypothetical protein GXY76_22645 [Chloroflexi bacterium]|nr:hypothetical protein [Chloroflexota bacterium]